MTQNDPENKKSKVSLFLTFLCNFCQSFHRHREIEKTFNKAKFRCPLVVYEEIKAVFPEEKDPKNHRKPEYS